MFDLVTIFSKVFVREFYRLNAGFFMIVLTLTFGFMSGVEHKALAEFFVASPYLSLIPVFVWSVYAVKVISFNKQRTALPENNFLYSFSIIRFSQQIVVSAQTLFLQFTPVVLYGLFLIIIGLKHRAVEPILIIVGSMAVLIVASAAILTTTLRTPIPEPSTSGVKRFIDRHTVRPLWWIYVTTILRREPELFIATKLFTGVLLFAVMRLYQNESFDGRLLAMAAALAGIGNFMVMMQLQLVDVKYFTFLKNLPIMLSVRWIRLALVTLLIVLPEIVVVLKYAPSIGMGELTIIIFLIPAIAFSAYSLLYLSFQKEETYARVMFAITMVHLVLILFKVPAFIFVIANLIASWISFNAKYYHFEMADTPKK